MTDSLHPSTSRPPSGRFGKGFGKLLCNGLGLDLRVGEGALCSWLFAFHFLVLAFQYTAKSIRQSAFIESLGAEQLPWAYLLVALCTYPLLSLYQRPARRLAAGTLLAVTSGAVALGMVAFGLWFRSAEDPRLPSLAFYLWTSVVGILLVSQFWSLAGLRFDPRQARRLFAFVGAGGILGSVAGGQVARWSSLTGGPFGALVAAAALLVLLVVCLGFFLRHVPGPVAAPAPESQTDRAPLPIFKILKSSPYLRRLSAGMLVAALVAQIVDLQFAWVVENATEGFGRRAAAFGNLYTIMGLTAFVFQMAFTARIHRRLGVGFALRVLPIANGVGAVAFLAAAALAPGLVWGVVWGLKIAENGLRYSLDQATRELLFLPIAEGRRAQAKTIVDVFVQRAAKGLAAVTLLTVTFGWLTVPQTPWLALVAVLVWLLIVEKTRRQYVASFRQGLLERVPDRTWADTLDLRDVDTLEILVAGLGSADPREVCHSLELLATHRREHLVAPWILSHDHDEVRLRALSLFERSRRRDAAPWIERLLSDPSPPVRAAATRALAAVAPDDLCNLMQERLLDRDPKVRSVAVVYLATQGDKVSAARAEDSLQGMIDETRPSVRREAAVALGELDGEQRQGAVIRLLYDDCVDVVRAAIGAVEQRCRRGAASPLFAPILVSHLRNRRLKHEARSALVAYGETIIPTLHHFLFEPGEDIWVRRALPKTLAAIGGPRALEALVDALATRDGLQRRKVVEALAKLRERGHVPDVDLIESQISTECSQYLELLLDLWALEDRSARPGVGLLERLIRDRLERHVANIFSLLGLLHPPSEIRSARRGLSRGRRDHRAHALEFLDNLLSGDLRQKVFAVIDDLPRDERLRCARRLFGLASSDAEQALGRWIRRPPTDDAEAPWLAAAALWWMHEERHDSLYTWIDSCLQRDVDPIVRETAELLRRKVA